MKVDDFAKEMFNNAQKNNASDIYLLPSDNKYKVYFRVFDICQDFVIMDKETAVKLIVHLKFIANMNVGENRRIQLGATNYDIEGKIIRLRISTVGDYRNQESMVIRLLHDFVKEEVRFILPEQKNQIVDLIEERGLYLFCGPVGSGKTTLMNYLAEKIFENQQIISIEDPVEIENRQILQLQINRAIGLSYSELIKLSLRHRPDLLIVGEIRDSETARSVIHAALTGYTVFSTVHAKSPSSIVSRMIELGITSSEMEHTLKGSVYQRVLGGVNGQGILLQIDQSTFISNEKWNTTLSKLCKDGIISRTVKKRESFIK